MVPLGSTAKRHTHTGRVVAAPAVMRRCSEPVAVHSRSGRKRAHVTQSVTQDTCCDTQVLRACCSAQEKGIKGRNEKKGTRKMGKKLLLCVDEEGGGPRGQNLEGVKPTDA
eukprot:1124338-Pelagomonas_calceolata.AAC.4